MKKIIHKANERGIAELGWLHSRFSFSFDQYLDQNKMGFGLLRVLNDDIIEEGEGFGLHPHNNMEIITILLEGELEHKDTTGTTMVLHPGEVQVMSAGKGLMHSEFNHSKVEQTKFLQIWIFPKERNITPRYDQRYFGFENFKNEIRVVASGNGTESSLYIHQDAAISIGKFEKGKEVIYKNIFKGNGSYLFVLDGSINFDDVKLEKRDAVGLFDYDELKFNTSSDASFLIIEVPMN